MLPQQVVNVCVSVCPQVGLPGGWEHPQAAFRPAVWSSLLPLDSCCFSQGDIFATQLGQTSGTRFDILCCFLDIQLRPWNVWAILKSGCLWLYSTSAIIGACGFQRAGVLQHVLPRIQTGVISYKLLCCSLRLQAFKGNGEWSSETMRIFLWF